MPHIEAKPITRTQTNVAEPPMFRVIYINDNQTSMGFVINSLVQHFEHTEVTAERITMDIHDAGSAVVAVLPYEMRLG